MKTLFINRHAKSSWKDPALSDFERPLNNRGKRDSIEMANRFKKREGSVDVIVSSTANRAFTTAMRFAEALGIQESQIQRENRIYEAWTDELLKVINGIDDAHDSAILFGHNPGFSGISSYLTNEYVSMPTCAIAKITFDVDSWEEISKDTGTLVYLDTPKEPIDL